MPWQLQDSCLTLLILTHNTKATFMQQILVGRIQPEVTVVLLSDLCPPVALGNIGYGLYSSLIFMASPTSEQERGVIKRREA